MITHALSHGLASLGRNGDTMLMHVSPKEVAGLQALGNITGHKLHTNPHTGMPEAFDFGDFFTSLLPTLAGVALAPVSGGSSLVPIIGGMATGAAVAGAKGEDPLLGGIMGGFGGYGGSGLGSAFAKMGGATAVPAISSGQGIQLAPSAITDVAGSMAPDATSNLLTQNLNNMTSTLTNPIGTGTGGAGIDLKSMTNLGGTDVLAGIDKIPGEAGIPIGSNALDLARPPSYFDALSSGLGKFASDPIGQYGAFKEAGGTGFSLGAPLAMAALSGAQEDLYPDTSAEEEKRKKEANKYRSSDPNYILNLSPDSGLRLAAGGAIPGSSNVFGTQAYQQDSTNAYSKPDGTAAQNTPSESYGIARLDNLMNQGASAKAANEFYAEGGPVAFSEGGLGSIYAHGGYLDGQGDGMSDSIHASIEGQQPARLADGEFVIPADVVSHIGNGSSKAGAQRLYSMLHKVRQARTGNPRQGKQINPNKYLPA